MKKVYSVLYIIVIFLPPFFSQCNSSDNVEKEVAARNAFELFMKKFPKTVLPFGCSIREDCIFADSSKNNQMTYSDCILEDTDALKFLCGNDKEWGTDPYMKSDTPSFVGEARLPDKGNIRVLIYTRTVGDLLDDDSCATYITLSTFLRDGKMCGKIVIGGADPLSYFVSHIDSAYTIYVSRIIYRDNPDTVVYQDTILCKVIHDEYNINTGGKILKTREYNTYEKYYFDPYNEGEFKKLENDSALKG